MLSTSFLNGGLVLTAARMNGVCQALVQESGLTVVPEITYNANNTLTLTDFQGALKSGATCNFKNQGETWDLGSPLGISVHVSSNSYQGTLVCAVDSDMFVESRVFVVADLLTQEQADVSNYLVLGWFVYPGSNAPLSDSQWISYPRARQDHWLKSWGIQDLPIPAGITVTLGAQGIVLANATGSDIQFTQAFMVPATEDLPRTLRFAGTLGSGCFIRATSGASLVGVMSDATNKWLPLWQYADTGLQIPTGPLPCNPWECLLVSVTFIVGAGSSITLNAIGVTTEVSVPT